MKIYMCVSVAFACLFLGGCESKQVKEDTNLTVATSNGPLELQIETDKQSRQEIEAEYNKPDRVIPLDASKLPCVERWFYEGESDLGFGKMPVAMYIDFDSQGNVCK